MTKEMGDTSKLLGFNVLGGSRGVLTVTYVEGVGCWCELGSAVRSVEQLVFARSLRPEVQPRPGLGCTAGVARGRGAAGQAGLGAEFGSGASGQQCPRFEGISGGRCAPTPPAPSNRCPLPPLPVRTRRAVVLKNLHEYSFQ